MRGKSAWFAIAIATILALGLGLRSAGLMRGLDRGIVFHPDSPKQVKALEHYLMGEKVWYLDSRFYDGYPYGLNVIDNLLIRAIYIPWRPIAQFLNPADARLPFPMRPELYYWVLPLRVFYGTLTLALTILLTLRLTRSRATTLAVGTIAALSPLSATVAHSGTGDIGVDLFTVALLVSLSFYCDRPRLPRAESRGLPRATSRGLPALALAGFCGGLAFACKYQGALALAVVGLFLLLTARPTRHSLAQLAARGAVVALAALLGAFAATPALHVNASSGWRNMRRNFLFLKDYGVSREFLALPTPQKLRISLSENIPLVLDALGWMLVLGYFVGLACALRRWWQSVRDNKSETNKTENAAAPALLLAIAIFPLFAILISTALKPAVQPFHFSYVVPPICVIAGTGLLALLKNPRPALRTAAALLGLAILAELVVRTRHECFFWLREDLAITAESCQNQPFSIPPALDKHWLSPPESVIKILRVENSKIPVFRNRPMRLMHPHADFWQSIHVLPGPTTPLEDASGWLFANGPQLPRDDRTFTVRANRPATHHLVLYDPVPASITLGLRAGRLPTELHVQGPRNAHTWRLNPNTQTLVQLSTQGGKRIPPAPDGTCGGTILPLLFHTTPSAAWISVLSDPREIANFNLTGGATNCPSLQQLNPALASLPAETIHAHTADLLFLERPDMHLVLTPRVLSLVWDDAEIALPAGRYILTCDVEAQSATNTLCLQLSDLSGWLADAPASHTVSLARGTHHVSFAFQKPFAPYEIHLLAACPSGAIIVRNWTLRPDTLAILDDLRAPSPPAWTQPAHMPTPVPEIPVGGVFFGKTIELIAHTLPASASPGATIPYNFRFKIINYKELNIGALGIFVHLQNARGETAGSLDFPLASASFNDGLLVPVRIKLPDNIPPGQYTVLAGVYNPALRKRLPARSDGPFTIVPKNAVKLATLEIRPRP